MCRRLADSSKTLMKVSGEERIASQFLCGWKYLVDSAQKRKFSFLCLSEQINKILWHISMIMHWQPHESRQRVRSLIGFLKYWDFNEEIPDCFISNKGCNLLIVVILTVITLTMAWRATTQQNIPGDQEERRFRIVNCDMTRDWIQNIWNIWFDFCHFMKIEFISGEQNLLSGTDCPWNPFQLCCVKLWLQVLNP